MYKQLESLKILRSYQRESAGELNLLDRRDLDLSGRASLPPAADVVRLILRSEIYR